MADPASLSPNPGHPDTRERIIEVAGALFADHGFRAVSLRRITREAGVNLASVNYHFGSKEALVVEVLSRVVGPINAERLTLLDEAEAECGDAPVQLERLLQVFFTPVMSVMRPHEKQESAQANLPLKLAGRCMAERDALIPETMLHLFEEVFVRFSTAFLKTLPELTREDIVWRLHFTVGALLYTLSKPEQLATFSEGEVNAEDSEETLRQLIAFSAAGMKAQASTAANPTEAAATQRRQPSRTPKGKKVAVPLLAGLAAVVSVGCAATSPLSMNDDIDVKVAEAYTAGQPGSGRPLADSDWVTRFGDRQLNALVGEALVNNKDLKVAEARLRVAQANAYLAGVDRKPKLDGALSGSRSQQNFIGFPFGGEPGSGQDSGEAGVISSLSNSFGASLDFRWEIDLWGRIRTEQSGAIAAMEASQADLAGAELSIAAQTAKTWFALTEALQQEQLAERSVALFTQTEQTISEHFALGINEQGNDRASQLRLARTDIVTAEEALVAQKEIRRQVVRQLEVLLARYPATEIAAVETLPKMPAAPPAGVPASLLDRRPDMVAAERRLAASDRRYAAARLLVLPAINLTGSGGTASEMVENLLDRNFSVWNIAGSAVQPILTGGQIREGIKLRKAEIVEAAGQYEGAVLVAFREVEDALDLEGFLAVREKLLAESVELSDDAFNKARQEFTEGVGDILTLLSAQRQKVQSETRYIAIRRLRLDNRVNLHLALGGDYLARRKS